MKKFMMMLALLAFVAAGPVAMAAEKKVNCCVGGKIEKVSKAECKDIGVKEGTDVDELKYQKTGSLSDASKSGELMTVKLRYKKPDGDKSKLIKVPVKDNGKGFGEASSDFKFASSVAQFGLLLRDSKYKFNASYDAIIEIGDGAKGKDEFGYRREFIDLVRNAKAIK